MTSVCQSSRMLLWGTSINDIRYFLAIFAPSPLTLPTLPDNFYHATSNFLRYFWPLCSLPIPKSDIIYGISLIKTAALSNKCHTFVVGLLSWSFQAWYNILHSLSRKVGNFFNQIKINQTWIGYLFLKLVHTYPGYLVRVLTLELSHQQGKAKPKPSLAAHCTILTK